MNEIHTIELPRLVIVGRGVIKKIGEVLCNFNFKKALIVTGRKTLEIAGLQASSILRENGLDVKIIVVNEANLETVNLVKTKSFDEKPDVIIGVGGGKIIDVAKLGATYVKLPFISVPTTASHDGISSCVASIKGLGRPYSIKANVPIAVLGDSTIISESPYRFTASGCGDVISKVVAVSDWKMAHEEKGEYYGEYASSLAVMSSTIVRSNASNIRDRLESGYRVLLEALVSCGVAMSIAGSSRPCSGSEHLFSHALDLIAPNSALHGEQCSVGTILMAKLHNLDWESLARDLKIIGVPTTAKELGVSREDVVKALLIARTIRPERFTILNKVNLTRELAEKLALDCGVI